MLKNVLITKLFKNDGFPLKIQNYIMIIELIYNNNDVVAKWIACGTLNQHIAGSNFSAASWLTM